MNELSDADLVKRFSWWWRGVFVGRKNKAKQLPPLATGVEALLSGAEANFLGGQLDVLFGILNQARERSAFLYELGARITSKYEWGKPWIELTEDQKGQLEQRWPDQQEHLIFEEGYGDKPPRSGWTRRITLSVNLALHNRTISTALLQLLNTERKRLGVPNPPPNQGMRRRPRSWKAIELLDIERYGVRALNNAETSQTSKAKKLAEQLGLAQTGIAKR